MHTVRRIVRSIVAVMFWSVVVTFATMSWWTPILAFQHVDGRHERWIAAVLTCAVSVVLGGWFIILLDRSKIDLTPLGRWVLIPERLMAD